MRGSLRLGTIAGIDLYLHWTFLLLLVGAFLFYVLIGGFPVAIALAGVGLIGAVFFCVVLHELGHALSARRYGIPTRNITLYPIGGVARLQRIPELPQQELVVALAGPAVNVVIAVVLAGVIFALGETFAFGRGLLAPHEMFLQNLFWINIVLVVFNMLPAFPMDGGRVLRSLLAMRMDYVRATQIAAGVGQAMAIMFGLFSIVIFNPFLLFIALFVYLGAQQEASFALMRTAIEGLPVSSAMLTQFSPLHPWDTLEEAVRLLLAGSEQDFPVIDEGRMIGVLTRKRLMHALAQGDERSTRIQHVMESVCDPADVGEMLDSAFRRMQESECPMLPVVRHGQLVGVLTTENVGELVMITSSLRQRTGGQFDPRQWFGRVAAEGERKA